MQSSLLKQFIYGTFFLLIILGIGYFGYLGVRPAASCFDGRLNQGEAEVDCGGPCQSCEIRRLKPIEKSAVSIIDSGNGTAAVFAELKNPNLTFGARSFAYKFRLIGENNTEIAQAAGNSFIYAGEVKFVIEAGIRADTNRVSRGELELSDLSWLSIAEFSQPKVQTRDIRVEGRDRKAIISGILVNQNSFKLEKAVVGALLTNELGLAVGASKTLLTEIQPFEERSFTVTIPNFSPIDLDADAAKISVETKRLTNN